MKGHKSRHPQARSILVYNFLTLNLRTASHVLTAASAIYVAFLASVSFLLFQKLSNIALPRNLPTQCGCCHRKIFFRKGLQKQNNLQVLRFREA